MNSITFIITLLVILCTYFLGYICISSAKSLHPCVPKAGFAVFGVFFKSLAVTVLFNWTFDITHYTGIAFAVAFLLFTIQYKRQINAYEQNH